MKGVNFWYRLVYKDAFDFQRSKLFLFLLCFYSFSKMLDVSNIASKSSGLFSSLSSEFFSPYPLHLSPLRLYRLLFSRTARPTWTQDGCRIHKQKQWRPSGRDSRETDMRRTKHSAFRATPSHRGKHTHVRRKPTTAKS